MKMVTFQLQMHLNQIDYMNWVHLGIHLEYSSEIQYMNSIEMDWRMWHDYFS